MQPIYARLRERARQIVKTFPPPDFYRDHGVEAVYVGHPLADQIQPDFNPAAARARRT